MAVLAVYARGAGALVPSVEVVAGGAVGAGAHHSALIHVDLAGVAAVTAQAAANCTRIALAFINFQENFVSIFVTNHLIKETVL